MATIEDLKTKGTMDDPILKTLDAVLQKFLTDFEVKGVLGQVNALDFIEAEGGGGAGGGPGKKIRCTRGLDGKLKCEVVAQ